MVSLGNSATGNAEKDASRFSHQNEKAEPGYYSVLLDDPNIKVELTATKRVGLHRYTFNNAGRASIILNLKWRDKVLDSELKVVSDTRIEGYRRSSSWAKNQVIYFVAEFSRPLKFQAAVAKDESSIAGARSDGSKVQTSIKAGFPYDVKSGEQIMVKVAISSVSIEGARKNLAAELPGWDFDKVRSDAKAVWNKELSKIEVSGGTDAQMTNFYTALYHTAIQPNLFQDVDGQYRGHDGKTHSAPKDTHYTVFSLWDTFRAAHPLYTIIDRKRTVDFINTFIRQYEQGGRLPVWELAGEETDTMIGYHAVSVIADAMAKDIEGFDYEKAYKAAKNSAELDHFGLAAHKKRGYISMEDEQESVSKTLEYAYNDWCIAQMARIIKTRSPVARIEELRKEIAYYDARSQYYQNLFDPSTGFMRPRQNGGFIKPFLPNEVTFHFTEGNSWQYSFFVPHAPERLMALMGGSAKFAAKLDELFTTEVKLAGREQPDITGMIGQYAHGNEPSHHIAYLYNYAGQPWKAQKLVRQIMDEFYKPTPDGLIGNEDCGQMSAWYILSASGFYPVAPGKPYYDYGTPLFKEVKYNLENGKTFTVKAPKVSPQNIYVASAKLNGSPVRDLKLAHYMIEMGGTLEFEMTDKPVEKPVNVSAGGLGSFTPVPVGKSLTAEVRFFKKPNDWTVKIENRYNRQYTGGGDEGLIDGIRGTVNWASGEWQGYQPHDFVAVIDLQRETEIKRLGGGFLQDARPWIWMPTRIEFEVSDDGVNFRKVADIKTDVDPTDMKPTIRDYMQDITPTKARYVRIRAYNLGKIPAWHPGAGFDAFIFVDEIFVE